MSSTLRCVAALELLAKEPYEYSLSEVAAHLGVNTTTAHRVLSTLVEGDFVEQASGAKRFRVTGKLLWVGTAYLRHSPVYLASFAILEDLARRADKMTHLAAWERDAGLYLHTVGPPGSQKLFSQIGERMPAHCTALGKAMLAWRPETELRRLFAQSPARLTSKTITSLSAMRRELDRVREQGYALDDEEGFPGIRCVAAPIRDKTGAAVAAISLSASAGEITPASAPGFGRMVQEAAVRVSVQLGFRALAANLAFEVGQPKHNGARRR